MNDFQPKSLNSAVCWEMYGIFQFLRTKPRVICRRRTAAMIPSVRCSVRVHRTEWKSSEYARRSQAGSKTGDAMTDRPLLNESHRWNSLKCGRFQSRVCAPPNRITNEIEKEQRLINSPFERRKSRLSEYHATRINHVFRT